LFCQLPSAFSISSGILPVVACRSAQPQRERHSLQYLAWQRFTVGL
jgi:hypothetical protein